MAVRYEAVSFQTKDKLTLHGLLTVPKNAKGVCIYIHGLTGSALNNTQIHALAPVLTSAGFGVFVIDTRGADIIHKVKKEDKSKPKGYVSLSIGTAFEVFTDCTFDIDAAVQYLQKLNVKNIHLIGHSTGCQKSIYYLSQLPKQSKIKSVLLLAPLSDYAAAIADPKLPEKTGYAKFLVKSGKKNTLLPDDLFGELLSAQRFLSLYTPNSKEEIFTYASGKKAKTLRSVTVPTLAVFGEKDEYLDRPVLELVEWFEENIHAKKKQVEWIEGANHSFKGKEKQMGNVIVSWLQGL